MRSMGAEMYHYRKNKAAELAARVAAVPVPIPVPVVPVPEPDLFETFDSAAAEAAYDRRMDELKAERRSEKKDHKQQYIDALTASGASITNFTSINAQKRQALVASVQETERVAHKAALVARLNRFIDGGNKGLPAAREESFRALIASALDQAADECDCEVVCAGLGDEACFISVIAPRSMQSPRL